MSNYSESVSDIHQYGIDLKNRKIYLHGAKDSEEDPGVDYKMSVNFLKNIELLDSINHKPIHISMQSIGGSWAPGMVIFDAITNAKSPVTIVVHGQAESMSSIILQAADKRLITQNAYCMIHYGSTSITGEYQNVQNWCRFEKQLLEVMIDIYAKKCKGGKFFKQKKYTVDQIKTYLKRKMKNGDWYMTASEAVYYGFADGIYK